MDADGSNDAMREMMGFESFGSNKRQKRNHATIDREISRGTSANSIPLPPRPPASTSVKTSGAADSNMSVTTTQLDGKTDLRADALSFRPASLPHEPPNQSSNPDRMSNSVHDTVNFAAGSDIDDVLEPIDDDISSARLRLLAQLEDESYPVPSPYADLSLNNGASQNARSRVHHSNDNHSQYHNHREKKYHNSGTFTAPSGMILSSEELRELRQGKRNERGEMAYFKPSFLEDPWAGLVPMSVGDIEKEKEGNFDGETWREERGGFRSGGGGGGRRGRW